MSSETFNTWLHRLIQGGLFLTPLIPLLVSPFLFFPYVSGKGFLFRIIIEIIFAAWLILALRLPRYRPKKSFISFAVLAFVLSLVLATVFSENPYKSFWSNFERMEGLISVLHLAAFFLVASTVIKEETHWRRLFFVWAGAALFEVLYTVLQYGGELALTQGNRLEGTFGNATYLAGYLLISLFLLAFLFFRTPASLRSRGILESTLVGSALFLLYYLSKTVLTEAKAGTVGITLILISAAVLAASIYGQKREKAGRPIKPFVSHTAFAVLAALFTVGIVSTATRGAILALGAGVFVATLSVALGGRTTHPKLFKVSLALISLAVLSVILFFLLRDVPAIRAHKVFGRIASISLQNDDAEARYRVWNIALKGFKERPILGWGQESFNFVFNKYYNPKLYGREQWFDRAHNAFLDWLVAGGLLAFLSYLALYAGVIHTLWRRPKAGPSAFSLPERAVLGGMVVGYGVQHLIIFENLASHIVLFMILAFLVSLSGRGEAQDISDSDGAGNGGLPLKENGITRAVPSVVVLLLLLAILYGVNVRPMSAGNALVRALRNQSGGLLENLKLLERSIGYRTFVTAETRERLSEIASRVAREAGVDSPLAKPFLDATRREFSAQIEAVPHDLRYHLFFGDLLFAYRRYDEALPHLAEGLAMSPRRQAIYFEMGNIYLNTGKFSEAMEVFKTALDLAPEFREPRIIYAVSAIYAGQYHRAEEILTEGGLTGGSRADARIFDAYFREKQYPRLIRSLKAVLEDEPNHKEWRLRLAGAYLQNGEPNRSIAEIRKVIEIDPSFKAQGESYIKDIEVGKR